MNKNSQLLYDELFPISHYNPQRNRSEDKFFYKKHILEGEEDQYFSFTKHFKSIVFWTNIDSTPIFFEGEVKEVTGYTQEEFLKGNLRWNKFIHPYDWPALSNSLESVRSVPGYRTEHEYRIIRKDGQIRWIHEFINNVSDKSGSPIFLQGALYDVTNRKKMEEKINALSLYDNLTGLFNKQGFLTLSEQQLKISRRRKSKMLLFVINIHNLVEVNALLGYHIGNQVLLGTSNILKKTFRESDLISRISGCKFAILAVDTYNDAEILLTRLKNIIDKFDSKVNDSFKIILRISRAFHNPKRSYSVENMIALAENNSHLSLAYSVAK